jgi:hypothetical protein
MSLGFAYKALDNLLFSVQADKEMWSAFRVSRTKQTYSEKKLLQ